MNSDQVSFPENREQKAYVAPPNSQLSIHASDIDSVMAESIHERDEGSYQQSHGNEHKNDTVQKKEDGEELPEAVVAKAWVCPECPKTFAQKFNLNKHVRQVHQRADKKNMKHIRKDGRVLCPVCGKDFAQPNRLKDHIIRSHNAQDLIDKDVDPKAVVGGLPHKREDEEEKRTDLQEIKQLRNVMHDMAIDEDTFGIIMTVSQNCPRLWLLA